MKVTTRDRDRDDLFINERIRDREVRVISADGEQLGIMSSREALRLAEEANLDLVKISPNAKPPVCKIIDYGKYKYEKTRKEKDAKRKQIVLRLPESLWREIARWAEDDFRSINGQIEFLLTEAVRKRR